MLCLKTVDGVDSGEGAELGRDGRPVLVAGNTSRDVSLQLLRACVPNVILLP